MVAEEKGVGGGMEWELGVSGCELLFTECINYKVLLYTRENCIQHPVINHDRKEYEKRKECTHALYNSITLLHSSN